MDFERPQGAMAKRHSAWPRARAPAGFIEYIIVAPIVAVLVCGTAAVVVFLVTEHFAGRGAVSTAAGIAAAIAALIIVVRFAIRDYSRRAGSIVTLSPDLVTIKHLGRTTRVDIDLINSVLIAPHGAKDQFILQLAGGGMCGIPVEAADVNNARFEIENYLGLAVLAKCRVSIRSGNALRVRESAARASLRMLNGLLTYVLAAGCLLSIKGISHGFELWREADLKIRRGWRGRRCDFEVVSDGVRPTGSILPSETCPWSSLRRWSVDEVGLVLEFDRRRFIASAYASNSRPLSVWLKSLSKNP